MLLNKIKKLKFLKQDLDNNTFVLKANKKIFKCVSTFSNYIKIFKFSLDCFIIQIDAIKYYK